MSQFIKTKGNEGKLFLDRVVRKRVDVPDEIQILVFTIMGTTFGVVLQQIFQLLEYDKTKHRDNDFFLFHEIIPFRGKEIKYTSPRVLIIRDEEKNSGIVVDQVKDIVSIKTDSIHPLPLLLKVCDEKYGILGTAVREDGIILLVDFYALKERVAIPDTGVNKAKG